LLMEASSMKGTGIAQLYPGRKFFGFFCSYWPEELVLAAGMEPIRIFPPAGNATPAELPAFCCSLARSSLSMARQGHLKDLAGVGLAHTCDTMQCLGGIWGEIPGQGGVLTMVPPVMLKASGAVRYYREEILVLARKLGDLSGVYPGNGEISRAVKLSERIRLLAAELDEIRELLPSNTVSAIFRAGQLMPRDHYAQSLEAALPELREMASPFKGGRQPVLVSSAILESDGLFEMIEELGGRVVADDTCTGYRHYSGVSGSVEDDPLDAIVRRYIEMTPCPCRNRGLDERVQYLEKLVRTRKTKGAILVIRKYCDPHAWDAVPVAHRLRTCGMKVLVLELEGSEVGGQERTRLQAFLESL